MVLLFIYNTFNLIICRKICPWSKREKLQKLYKRSEIKIDKALNVFSIVRNLNLLKVAMKSSILSD